RQRTPGLLQSPIRCGSRFSRRSMPSAESTSPLIERESSGESLTGLSARASGGRRGDWIFSNLAKAAGILILITLGGVAVFLVIESMPAITADAARLPEGKSFISYVAPLAFGTALAAILAVLIAIPIAIAVALFISHIAPRRLALTLSYIVDLLAAIPSIIYGLWGIFVLGPAVVPTMG